MAEYSLSSAMSRLALTGFSPTFLFPFFQFFCLKCCSGDWLCEMRIKPCGSVLVVPRAGWVLRAEPDFWVLFQQDTQIQVLLELICRSSARSCWSLGDGGATGPSWGQCRGYFKVPLWVGGCSDMTEASLMQKG